MKYKINKQVKISKKNKAMFYTRPVAAESPVAC